MVSQGREGIRCGRKMVSDLTNQALVILRSGGIIERIYFSLAKRDGAGNRRRDKG